MEDSHGGNPALEIWFEFGSTYSYLSVMRVEALARDAGVPLQWKPFLLGPIFRNFGWETSPFLLQEAKGRYMWRDMERQAAKYGLPFRKPSVFPRMAILPMRVAIFGAEREWMPAFCRTVMQQNWFEDVDINSPGNVRCALLGLVDDPDQVIEEAQSDENKLKLREQTEEAQRRGIFGGPTFFVGDEMYWGNDRLDDAVAHAAASQTR
jgi:2-hydroxychromene-2-carboxylate isomerase